MNDRLGDKIRLQHIIDAINEIESYLGNADIEIFKNNSMMLNACLRQLEVVGEASNRLSKEIIEDNTQIPWAKIIGLRNMIIHEYFGVDKITIWNIIKLNIPDFKTKIELLVLKM